MQDGVCLQIAEMFDFADTIINPNQRLPCQSPTNNFSAALRTRKLQTCAPTTQLLTTVCQGASVATAIAKVCDMNI
jgi:hypothetical protein